MMTFGISPSGPKRNELGLQHFEGVHRRPGPAGTEEPASISALQKRLSRAGACFSAVLNKCGHNHQWTYTQSISLLTG